MHSFILLMKRLLLFLLASVSTLSAGIPSARDLPKSEIVPARDPLWTWFAGGGGGYLLDNEEDMWHGHVGVNLPWKIAGFESALFLELGWTEIETHFGYEMSYVPSEALAPRKGLGTSERISINSELDLIPLTLNAKLERPLFGPVSIYAAGGLGVAFLDVELDDGTSSRSDDDTVFFAQLFGGFLVNLTPTFEMYAGARWIYIDQPDFTIEGTDFDLDDIDVSNDDVLLEAGGRVNF